MNFFDFGEVIENDTEFVIFGIPWDYLTSIGAPNSAIAPDKIREVTNDMALTTEMGKKIPSIKAIDLGDIEIVPAEVEKNLKKIKNFMGKFFELKKDVVPVMIGGDHFCSYPAIKTACDNFNDKEKLGVLIFDAHLDLYEEWDKGVYSHATISHRVYDLDYITNNNLLVVGTRDIDIPELEIAEKEEITHLNSCLLADENVDSFGERIVKFFKASNIEHLYISIDIDVLDPSVAPATGFAIPGGLSYRELWKLLRNLANEFNIFGFDVVEIAPNLDMKNNMTSILGAKLIVELMSFIEKKSRDIDES